MAIFRIVLNTLQIILYLIGVLGNAAVFWIVYVNERLRTKDNSLHVSLAAYDFLACLLTFIRKVLDLSFSDFVPMEFATRALLLRVSCDLERAMTLTTSANMLVLANIAVMRSWNVLYPLHTIPLELYVSTTVITFLVALVLMVVALQSRGRLVALLCSTSSVTHREHLANVSADHQVESGVGGTAINRTMSEGYLDNPFSSNATMLPTGGSGGIPTMYLTCTVYVFALVVTVGSYCRIFARLSKLNRQVAHYGSYFPKGCQSLPIGLTSEHVPNIVVSSWPGSPQGSPGMSETGEPSRPSQGELSSSQITGPSVISIQPVTTHPALSGSVMGRSVKQDRHLAVSNFLVVAVFLGCYLPLGIVFLLVLGIKIRINRDILEVPLTIVGLNHIVNPFIYWSRSKEFKREFGKILAVVRGCACRERRNRIGQLYIHNENNYI